MKTKDKKQIHLTISGSELRNLFNLTLRKLYSSKDNNGNELGKTAYLNINNLGYIDVYIKKCEDLLDSYYNLDEIENYVMINFLDEFEKLTIYFLGNEIKEETRFITKKYFEDYLNKIGKYYLDEEVKYKLEKSLSLVRNFVKKPVVKTLKKPKKSRTISIGPVGQIEEINEENYEEINEEEEEFEMISEETYKIIAITLIILLIFFLLFISFYYFLNFFK